MRKAPITVNLPSDDEMVIEKFVPLFQKNNDTYRYILTWGSRHSAKSFSIARRLIVKCLEAPAFKCILVRKTFESIADSSFAAIEDDIITLGLESLFRITRSPLTIKCYNGNSFICRGLDNIKKVKSLLSPTDIWYEEATEIDNYDDFLTLSTTLRSNKTKILQEWFSFNPEVEGLYEDHWIYQQFFEGHSENSFEDSTTIELQNGSIVERKYKVIHSTYEDNKYTTPLQMADLESYKDTNPYYYTIYSKGLWGNRTQIGRYLKSFDRFKHVSKLELDLEKSLHISFDENVNPHSTLLVFQQYGLHLKQIHEICLITPNNRPDNVCRELVKWLKDKKYSNDHSICIYGDTTSDKEHAILKKGVHYFTMLKSILDKDFSCRICKSTKNPGSSIAADFINSVFENKYDGIKISIGDTCIVSITDYLMTQEKSDGTIKKTKNRMGWEKHGHNCDALKYIICEMYKESFCKYKGRISGGKIYMVSRNEAKRRSPNR